jgi:Ni/Fe-hydrogenase subunit HybB-like protein
VPTGNDLNSTTIIPPTIGRAAMFGEADMASFQAWLQIGTSSGFVGLAWYLIVVALPKMQDRFDMHSDKQLSEFKEQLRFIVERHETTVQAVISAQEKQIDRIMGHVSRAHQ